MGEYDQNYYFKKIIKTTNFNQVQRLMFVRVYILVMFNAFCHILSVILNRSSDYSSSYIILFIYQSFVFFTTHFLKSFHFSRFSIPWHLILRSHMNRNFQKIYANFYATWTLLSVLQAPFDAQENIHYSDPGRALFLSDYCIMFYRCTSEAGTNYG